MRWKYEKDDRIDEIDEECEYEAREAHNRKRDGDHEVTAIEDQYKEEHTQECEGLLPEHFIEHPALC